MHTKSQSISFIVTQYGNTFLHNYFVQCKEVVPEHDIVEHLQGEQYHRLISSLHIMAASVSIYLNAIN